MKLILLFLVFVASSAYSQSCQEVVFTDSTERNLLIEYEMYLRNNLYTRKNLGGVIVLYRFENGGDKCWRLKYYVDDTCLDECPVKYSYSVFSHIVLIHDADENGMPIPDPNCPQAKACIETIVEGWLYIHPRKDKWMVYKDSDGKPQRVNISKQPKTSLDDSYMVRFKKDGSVEAFHHPGQIIIAK